MEEARGDVPVNGVYNEGGLVAQFVAGLVGFFAHEFVVWVFLA